MEGEVCRVEKVSISYRNERVVTNVSMTVSEGCVTGVVGRSGVGKTSILNAISGLIDIDTGQVTINSMSPSTAALKQELGYVFQHSALLPWRTVRENVELPFIARSSEIARDTINEALNIVGLSDSANLFPGQLSGGMKTRVELARVIAYRPSLLLLDEPFDGLDDPTKENLYGALQKLIEKYRMAVVLVTHNLTECLLLSDVVKILAGKPAEFTNSLKAPWERPRTPELYTRQEFMTLRQQLRDSL